MSKSFLKRFLVFFLWGLLAVWLVSCVIIPLFHKKIDSDYLASISPSVSFTNPAPEQVRSIDNNKDALLWRLRLVESAQKNLVITTFAFSDDNSGTDFLSAVKAAADRGVEVRILIDGMDGSLNLSHSPVLKALISMPNVQAKLYNPINLLKPWRLNYRMHDKYVIADDCAYLLGGRNTNDLFLGDYSEKSNIDREILVWETQNGKGQSFLQLRSYFESVWSLPCCKQLTSSLSEEKKNTVFARLDTHYRQMQQRFPEAFTPTDWEAETIPANSVSLLSNPQRPQNKEPLLWYSLQQLMQNGEEIIIQTPYIICNREMYQALSEITESGKSVQMITNALENGANPWGCSDYLNQKKKILKTGSEIFELYKEHSSHTKTMLIDNHLSVVGSFNLDMRSAYLDTEMMLLIDCPELNAQLRCQAEQMMQYSNHVLPNGQEIAGEQYHPPKTGFLKNAVYTVLRVLILPVRHLL